jgi:nitroimidazol reductase NimA-like FMN-containing flavoprotein (pyridoxamine 5'-phosphate oxidase superfamily)
MQHRVKTHPLSKKNLDKLLLSTSTGSLATLNNDGSPYVTPVHFLYHDGDIYIHGVSLKGRKLATLGLIPACA